MIDVSSCEKISDENRGVNEKLWIDVNGRPALFKKTQIRDNGTHTNAHYGEAFVSEMCRMLDYKCAEIEIAERNGEIGCISYSFLKEGDELVDFISLLQNVRPTFDSKKMLVPETNETYSIPLILDALEEEAASEEEFKALKKDFFKSCIIDSLIEHYDRNPSNISVIRNNGHISFSPMFDNGTSLNISIPRDVLKENGNDEEWFKFLREKNKSKIGVEGEKYSNYDKLLDYILSNYYEDVADFIGVIKEKLTKENITKILGRDDYAGLDNVFKEIIINKTTDNVRGLVEKSKEYENKYTVEQYMKSPNAYNLLKEKVKNQDLQIIIPEISDCIDLPQRNPYHIYSVDDYMFHCIEGINNIEQIAQENGIKLKISDKNKSLLQWSILFNELGKPKAREEVIETNGNVRDTFRNYSVYGQEMAENLMERLNFYETDRKIVTALVSSHQRRELDTDSAIKRLINEVGERNIDLYFGMKLAEIKSKNPELEKESISKLKILKEKIDRIIANDNREVIRALPLNGEQMKRLGLKGQQIGEVLNSLAQFVKSDSSMYAYYKSRGHLEKYRKDIAKQSQTYAKEIKHKEKLKQPEENKMEKNTAKLEFVSFGANQEHLLRHMEGDCNPGSKMSMSDEEINTMFSATNKELASLIDEHGNPGRRVIAVKADKEIGTSGAMPIDYFDKSRIITISRDIGNPDRHDGMGDKVNVVIIPEKDMVKAHTVYFIAGPWGDSGKYGPYTAFPEPYAPPFPNYKIDPKLPQDVQERIKKSNKEYAEEWSKLVMPMTEKEALGYSKHIAETAKKFREGGRVEDAMKIERMQHILDLAVKSFRQNPNSPIKDAEAFAKYKPEIPSDVKVININLSRGENIHTNKGHEPRG